MVLAVGFDLYLDCLNL